MKVAAIGIAGVAVAAVVTALTVFILRQDTTPEPAIELQLPAQIARPDPLRFEPGLTEEYEQAAAFGLSHVLFEKSPGGAIRAAQRTARFRSMVDEATSGTGIDPDMVEAIVLLESAGRQDVIAGDDPANAAGLTQIVAGTATDFLGMQVDLEESRRLTRLLDEAVRRGDAAEAARLRSERGQVDARFDPEQALAGTVRYLTEAKKVFGRDDLAVVSYHMGIGNLSDVVRAYTAREDDPIDTIVREADIDYARLYFDSSPTVQRASWELLASLGDDSQTYYWRVLGALGIMHLLRNDPGRLERLAELHDRLPSAALVLHPPGARERYADATQLEDAVASGVLVPARPSNGGHWTIDPQLLRVLAPLTENPARYVALRPRAARFLAYLSAKVHELSGEERPLALSRAAYDHEAATTLTPHDPGAAADADAHSTGFAFDIRRRYGSGAQAAAFQWALERLETLGLIAWTRGRSVIHVVVSPRADA
ncbi:MAG TPA: transglycosylase SLT domain-containing protein [Gaiellaceae bacterium]|nr:transglycosylase SLT domain-containing protein [Gaiellaceae bacterium]